MTGIPNYNLLGILGGSGGSNGLGQTYPSVYGNPCQQASSSDYGAALAAAAAYIKAAEKRACAAIPSEGIRAGEIVAYRAWMVDDDELRSVSMNCLWEPNESMTGNVSEGNGIHCFKELTMAKVLAENLSCLGARPHAIGSIEIWGEIVEHEWGYRAQYAAIKSIDGIHMGLESIRKSVWERYFGKSDKRRPELLNRLCEKYLDAGGHGYG